jgi:hypothetical protein
VHFEGIRAGQLPAVTGWGPSRVEPIWDTKTGPPAVVGFRVTVASTDADTELTRDVPRTYVRTHAHDLGSTLVKEGALKAGDVYTWTLHAFASDTAPAAADDDDFAVAEIAEPLPIVEAPLAPRLDRAAFAGLEDAAAEHVPVFMPQHVLDETEALARAAGDVETGGMLVGRLCRDGATLFVEVTAQIPAQHAVSAAAKLTFTSETWAAARAAIALRRRAEILIGWWHFHPSWCRLRQCPPERRRECDGANPFFSADDVQLHASVFPAGHHVALLVSEGNRSETLDRSLFGWWQGMVVSRGFHVLGGTTNATQSTAD